MAQDYKTLKEDFVSNLSGGSVSEINYVIAVAPVSTSSVASICQANEVTRPPICYGLYFRLVEAFSFIMAQRPFSQISYLTW